MLYRNILVFLDRGKIYLSPPLLQLRGQHVIFSQLGRSEFHPEFGQTNSEDILCPLVHLVLRALR